MRGFQTSSISYQKLIDINKEFERSRSIEYEVIRNNDWLQDYSGWTYSDQLRDTLARGLFEEHSKKADVGMAGIEKALVFCLDPETLEIQKNGVAGSSLLREKKSDKIWENLLQRTMIKKRQVIGDLILDNFGLAFAKIVAFPAVSATQALVDITNASHTFHWNNNTPAWAGNPAALLMGSGTTAPARANYSVQTLLVSAPENNILAITSDAAYTGAFTVIYQADANPTGGSGTVNEICSINQWKDIVPTVQAIAITRDVLNNGLSVAVPYTAGKLLRGAFTWQL